MSFWTVIDVLVPVAFGAVVVSFVATGRLGRLWSRSGTSQRVLTGLGLLI